jgi:hypothetical protein
MGLLSFLLGGVLRYTGGLSKSFYPQDNIRDGCSGKRKTSGKEKNIFLVR